MDNKKSKEKHFKNFVKLVEDIWQDFCFWNQMQHPMYKSVYNKNLISWQIIFRSVQDRLLLNLHEIFNNDLRKQTLDVYTLLRQIDNVELRDKFRKILCGNCELKMKIGEWRNNLVAHKNKQKIFKEKEELETKYKIVAGSIEAPILNLFEILQKFQAYFTNESIDYDEKQEEIKKEIGESLNKILLNNK